MIVQIFALIHQNEKVSSKTYTANKQKGVYRYSFWYDLVITKTNIMVLFINIYTKYTANRIVVLVDLFMYVRRNTIRPSEYALTGR